jgi:hypothetical protein
VNIVIKKYCKCSSERQVGKKNWSTDNVHYKCVPRAIMYEVSLQPTPCPLSMYGRRPRKGPSRRGNHGTREGIPKTRDLVNKATAVRSSFGFRYASNSSVLQRLGT